MTEQTQNVGQTRPRRWAVVVAHRHEWKLLPGIYETHAGAQLCADVAQKVHDGAALIAEVVVAGPDAAQRSEAEEPSEAVRCSELLERLRVIHMGALAALAEAEAGGADRLHRIIGKEIGADLVRAGMLSRYEELGPTDEDGESFIVFEMTAVGAAAGLAWGKAMRRGRSNMTEQVGVADGWRLLDEDEVEGEECGEIEGWDSAMWDRLTYRTRLTRAELRKARSLDPEALPKGGDEPCLLNRPNTSDHATQPASNAAAESNPPAAASDTPRTDAHENQSHTALLEECNSLYCHARMLERELAVCREALARYGEHRASCMMTIVDGHECTCGLAAALTAAAPKETK